MTGVSVAQANQVIYAKGLSSHGCDDTEWHFIITQVEPPELAPAEIYVTWTDGSQETLPLDGVTGKSAHYYWYNHLEVPVQEAWTEIYDGWSGEFNLSHGPCFDDPTPTPPTPPTSTSSPTMTPTSEEPTATPTQTSTQIPTNTPTNTPTPTHTNTPTVTPTYDPNTPTPTATGTQPTQTPTNTPTQTATPTATPIETQTPTATQPTPTQTTNPTETPTVSPTETPRPPVPAEAFSIRNYQGRELGTLFMDGDVYKLYQGVNAPDGTLALPSAELGAAQYNNVIWVHRAWNSGWLSLKLGDMVALTTERTVNYYKITAISELPYGVYPDERGFYIATCMSNNGENWTNVQLFKLELQRMVAVGGKAR